MSGVDVAPVEPTRMRDALVCFFRDGHALRSRSVSDVVLSGRVDIPAPPARLTADWTREISLHLGLEPGDVEMLSLARARARWKDYRQCLQAVNDWTHLLGMPHVLATSAVALMACRGARYHHDGAQYGGSAFCNLFLSEDKGQDLHFPSTGHRIALSRGTVVVFDTGQPHAVIRRDRGGFDVADFPADQDRSQLFLTWELAMTNDSVGQALRIRLDIDPSTSLLLDEEQVWMHGARARVCPHCGRWCRCETSDGPGTMYCDEGSTCA